MANVDVLRSDGAGSEGVPGNQFTRVVEDARREGRPGLVSGRSRLHAYDRVEGLANSNLRFEVDKTDRMPVAEAAATMVRIHQAHGVSRSMEGFQYGYDHALFICYAINGSSQAGPMERVKFAVMNEQGEAQSFEYATVPKILGIDFRRFFRTYANDVVDACHQLYFGCNFEDPIQVEMRDLMIQVADNRNISRFPWLIADCVDAATNLNTAQYAAAMASKQSVIATATNAVDRRNLALPIRTMDGYDSSIGQVAPQEANNQTAPATTYYS